MNIKNYLKIFILTFFISTLSSYSDPQWDTVRIPHGSNIITFLGIDTTNFLFKGQTNAILGNLTINGSLTAEYIYSTNLYVTNIYTIYTNLTVRGSLETDGGLYNSNSLIATNGFLYSGGNIVLTNAPPQLPPTNWSSYAALSDERAEFGFPVTIFYSAARAMQGP